MDALELLLTRSSFARLDAPAPEGKALDNIINAGLRAPDHANLTPFEFVVCTGKGLDRLTDIFTNAAVAANREELVIEKSKKMCYRAPMIIVAIMRYKEHEKVPRVEQIATTACAVQNMQMAAFAQGYNGIWRTGSFAFDDNVRTAFDLQSQDEIVGFLYLGTPAIPTPIKKAKAIGDTVSYWR
ncbi:NAD(P)H nitroreductase [Psychrosphaera sp. B3R10]|uniref:NAD(P)H nitroreductase n=1 Tax=unclassified Psychrosphaera TaxID=2641570 RepID=UPI001C0939C9|nr:MULTISPECIES: NAD(P)H nitroreductase [unclassified Psychrosphaera]MBU2882233.1 NAD(P)H nitroreductase [Psychrosphaera sp. I2R16]MBU2988914.1 NAD(P)H nitroreductase [Psychrosphaera sp. B3R10]